MTAIGFRAPRPEVAGYRFRLGIALVTDPWRDGLLPVRGYLVEKRDGRAGTRPSKLNYGVVMVTVPLEMVTEPVKVSPGVTVERSLEPLRTRVSLLNARVVPPEGTTVPETVSPLMEEMVTVPSVML